MPSLSDWGTCRKKKFSFDDIRNKTKGGDTMTSKKGSLAMTREQKQVYCGKNRPFPLDKVSETRMGGKSFGLCILHRGGSGRFDPGS